MMNSTFGQPAVISGIFNCGRVANLADDGSAHVVVIALEQSGRTFFVRDELPVGISELPVGIGSALHRLANAVTGFTMRPADVKIEELLGAVVLAVLAPSDHLYTLHRVGSFPKPPRTAPRELQMISHDPRLGGSPDRPVPAGGDAPRRVATWPTPPTPKHEPRFWSIATQRRGPLPLTLPRCVLELASRSEEFRALK
jgi:hypothetical protein